MTPRLRHGIACTVVLTILYALSPPAGAQDKEYAIKVMPPGGPAPRLADGHPDLSGHWLPNSAGQGLGGRFGVDPAAAAQFDPKVTPEEPPALQPWASAKIKSMTATEIELAKPWRSAPRRWTLGDGEVYEFFCTNNRELEELQKLRQQELERK